MFSRVYKAARVREEALNDLMVQGLDREMANCTFQPNVRSGRGSPRRFGEFLKDQRTRAMRRDAEIIRLREREVMRRQGQCKRVPTISPV